MKEQSIKSTYRVHLGAFALFNFIIFWAVIVNSVEAGLLEVREPAAWASNWNIRQFQQIGGPGVTGWREARRLATQPIATEILEKLDSKQLRALIHAADNGDWQTYTNLSGGPTTARQDIPLRALVTRLEKQT